MAAPRLVTAPVGRDGTPVMTPGELLEVYGRQVEDLAATAASVQAGARAIVAALSELRVVLAELAGGLAAPAAPPRECINCWVRFEWDESPDDDRCAPCAEVDWNGCGCGAGLDTVGGWS